MKFLGTVCMAAVCTALFRLLVPENKFTKQIALLITGIFLFTGISAFTEMKFDSTAEDTEIKFDENYERISEGFNDHIRNIVCQNMRDRLQTLLNEHEIFPKEIYIAVNISGLYSIKFTQVELVFAPEEQDAAEAAAELLSSNLPSDIGIILTVDN